jgi:hypothetical protein
MSGTYWKWWKTHSQPDDNVIASKLFDSLKAHYTWCLSHTVALSYKEEEIKKHLHLVEEYFSE